ncbi:hypothetical protein [Olivibacter domesticus]|uniref:Uncharacterized protein n=1 Tax=Olivibacter domesticus TaxID=407022 RepID=A0A1H7XIQ9_OLID1|nr:hypothetical protein [Olivibacter domesticus]SEM33555.1 hypothetical protein SAMN05661044_04912 [Olivibacter domesticus]
MDKRVEDALKASVQAFEKIIEKSNSNFLLDLIAAFESDENYMQKVDLLDQCFDDYPQYEDLREVVFDLLLMNFFAADVEKLEEDYLESEEWEEIEEQTIDRGTELLNLLLYLRECTDDEVEPELDDFLKEFLLVDEDEFQDEYRIYEPMIANQILIDSDYQEIQKVANKLDEEQELAELFYPIMSFFAEKDPSSQQFDQFIKNSSNPGFDAAVYTLAIAYNQN